MECSNSYSSPQSIWKSPRLYWKTLFVKLHTEVFIGAKFDNDMSTIFLDNPDQKFFVFQITRMHTLLLQPSFHLNKFLTRLKNTFRETAYWHHLRAEFNNDISTFFVDNSDQKLFLFQNLLVCMHSYSSTQLIWTSSWPDWRTLFVKLHTEIFIGAKFVNDMSTFFVDKPDQKFLLSENY